MAMEEVWYLISGLGGSRQAGVHPGHGQCHWLMQTPGVPPVL